MRARGATIPNLLTWVTALGSGVDRASYPVTRVAVWFRYDVTRSVLRPDPHGFIPVSITFFLSFSFTFFSICTFSHVFQSRGTFFFSFGPPPGRIDLSKY
ncbi:hypothetical protein F5X96DRAFT_645428 [Biscogniauxia mediterranea]|nr:hypothetical protein F5X96DRAFT_645428 [Biscogniauxia mediterranea]